MVRLGSVGLVETIRIGPEAANQNHATRADGPEVDHADYRRRSIIHQAASRAMVADPPWSTTRR